MNMSDEGFADLYESKYDNSLRTYRNMNIIKGLQTCYEYKYDEGSMNLNKYKYEL